MGTLNVIPQEFAGWRQDGSTRTYDRETIFDYIDGAGEVYRLYDFRDVAVYRFRKRGVAPVDLEVFDMGSAGDAFGIFTFYHEGRDVDIGRGAYQRPGLVNFWQGRYFICLTSSPAVETEDADLVQLAKEIARLVPDEGHPPAWLKLFPDRDRRPQSLRYFHNHAALNYHLFVSEKNILNLTPQTECALARFRAGPESFWQLWIRYPDTAAADAALTLFEQAYLAPGATKGLARDKQRRWTATTRQDRFISIALGAPTRPVADSVRISAAKILREAKNEK